MGEAKGPQSGHGLSGCSARPASRARSEAGGGLSASAEPGSAEAVALVASGARPSLGDSPRPIPAPPPPSQAGRRGCLSLCPPREPRILFARLPLRLCPSDVSFTLTRHPGSSF